MTAKYLIALDQGTTSSRAVLFDTQAALCGIAQQELTQHYPQPGWVEHDASEIWSSQHRVLVQLIQAQQLQPGDIAAMGIANQRETTVVWHRETGQPIYPAIVWQDRRTAPLCERLKALGLEAHIRTHTGLVLDAYFSGPKLQWILDNVNGARTAAERGELCFGTVDSWLIWNLTGGRVHATDITNASRTMLFDIDTLDWDDTLLEAMHIPRAVLPEVRDCTSHFGEWQHEGHRIPITGVAGDQHAALFGQTCFAPGSAKNTYGTGCFLLSNTGTQRVHSTSGLISTIAWRINGQTQYALEGSVFIAGAAVQWLRDGLQIIQSAAESESLAQSAQSTEPVYLVPAFVGLGAPYWDMYARGAIFGLAQDTGRAELARAALHAMAYQTRDVLDAMQKDAAFVLPALQVDGGAAANNLLMQFQADILGVPIERPKLTESTALGAAYLAGLSVGLWLQGDLPTLRSIDRMFTPLMETKQRDTLYAGWQKAVARSQNWLAAT